MADASVRIHRFHDAVAIHAGDGQTVYMTKGEARKLFKGLGKACRSLETEPFHKSSGLTLAVDAHTCGIAMGKASKAEKEKEIAKAEKALARAQRRAKEART